MGVTSTVQYQELFNEIRIDPALQMLFKNLTNNTSTNNLESKIE